MKEWLINKKRKTENFHNYKTDIKMTLMKAFGIIAVVAGHTNGGAIGFPMANWVMPYFYYMPLFVFVSGYLYKLKYDEVSIAFFLKKKLWTLVVPYFIWNAIYGLIVSFFRDRGIVEYGAYIYIVNILCKARV